MSSTAILGNLTVDLPLSLTASGQTFAKFTIAFILRQFDKAAGHWADGDTVFLCATMWGEQAEGGGESLKKGDRVLATGTQTQFSHTDKDGITQTRIVLSVDEVGPSLCWVTSPDTPVAAPTVEAPAAEPVTR